MYLYSNLFFKQNGYFKVTKEKVIETIFKGPLRIGSRPDPEKESFDGRISCLQIYDDALDQATVHYKSTCKDADSSLLKTSPCTDGYDYYEGQCYYVSLSKDTFSKAEVKCLPKVDSLYRSQLLWTENPKVWHHFATIVKEKTGSSMFHAGISDQDNDGFFETRYNYITVLNLVVSLFRIHSLGENITLAESKSFIEAKSRSGECGVVDVQDAGYLSTGDCEKKLPYVCSSQPLDAKPDFDCPKGFFSFKNKCLYPDQRRLTYDDAMVC